MFMNTLSVVRSACLAAVLAAGALLNANAQDNVPREAKILMECYPQWVKGFENNSLILADGSKITWDDGKKKSFVELLNHSDVQDMFAFKYDRSVTVPSYQQDPGRNRCEALYKKMYGASSAAVDRNCVRVNWFGQRLPFNSNNGAADSLKAVANELAKHPELKKYLKSAGTKNWRCVAGTTRLSPHSFATAIDVGVGYSHYWQWSCNTKDENAKLKYANKIPLKMVEIFEKHGFIWGGRWYHFDTMHFEFRPDLLKAAQ